MELELYFTEGCHLCDLAENVIKQAVVGGQLPADVQVEKIDIATDDRLIESYGVLIPVLKLSNSSAIISWPFTSESLQDYLVANKS